MTMGILALFLYDFANFYLLPPKYTQFILFEEFEEILLCSVWQFATSIHLFIHTHSSIWRDTFVLETSTTTPVKYSL